MISVLSLDIAPHGIGWAVGKPDIVRNGKAGWGMFYPEVKPDQEHVTLLRFAHFLDRMHEQYKFTHIIWERIFINPKNFTEATKRMQYNTEGICLVFCAANNVDPSDVTIDKWRKEAFGFTEAPPHRRQKPGDARKFWKESAMQWAAMRGWMVDKDDEAEALAIMHYLLQALDKTYRTLTKEFSNRGEQDAFFKRGAHGL